MGSLKRGYKGYIGFNGYRGVVKPEGYHANRPILKEKKIEDGNWSYKIHSEVLDSKNFGVPFTGFTKKASYVGLLLRNLS